jgi:hypothetical protein
MSTRNTIVWLVVTVSIWLVPMPSAAGGGNWLEFRRPDRTGRDLPSQWDIFAVGETAVASVSYLSRAFDEGEGPFHLWVEQGDELAAGRAIPATALRVGTFDMDPGGVGGRALFRVPAVPSGQYTFSVCDDPCTTLGFDEFVQGWAWVVQTPAEATFLARLRDLRDSSRQQMRSVMRRLRGEEEHVARLEERLGSLRDELSSARGQIDRLIGLATRDRRASGSDEALIDGWGGAWIAAAAIGVAVALLRRRRPDRIEVPDTPAELIREEERELPIG